MKILTTSNPKIKKSIKYGYNTAILHFKPWRLYGYNFCPCATPGCIGSCLNTSGRGGIKDPTRYLNTIQAARRERSRMFIFERETFLFQLEREVALHERRSANGGLLSAYRLNGTSDVAWEEVFPRAFRIAPMSVWYDYTKDFDRILKYDAGQMPVNYHLTFSRSEKNEDQCREVLKMGRNVAVVFDGAKPKKFWGYDVADGDLNDLIFLHRSPCIIALKAKGRAKKDKTGFVVRI